MKKFFVVILMAFATAAATAALSSHKCDSPTSQPRKAYSAECVHCKCKGFVPERTGSTRCVCGHLKNSHVKRYF